MGYIISKPRVLVFKDIWASILRPAKVCVQVTVKHTALAFVRFWKRYQKKMGLENISLRSPAVRHEVISSGGAVSQASVRLTQRTVAPMWRRSLYFKGALPEKLVLTLQPRWFSKWREKKTQTKQTMKHPQLFYNFHCVWSFPQVCRFFYLFHM